MIVVWGMGFIKIERLDVRGWVKNWVYKVFCWRGMRVLGRGGNRGEVIGELSMFLVVVRLMGGCSGG